MKKLLSKPYAPIVAVLWNILLVYAAYMLARVAYYFENISYFSCSFDIVRGGLLFDTSAIVYTNAIWIVLMLLPWRFDKVCKWLFLVVNGLALAVNLADAVYFQYTMRRTTTTVFSEFSNEGNLGSIVGTEFINHWYLVLLFGIMMYLLWRFYATPRRHNKVCVAALLIAVPLCIAGMRGGFTTAVRPITISNANQYAQRPTDAALVLNTPFSLIRTIGKSVFVVPNYYDSEAELEKIYSPLHINNNAVNSKKKNVVILIVESFGREYIGALNRDLDGGRYKGYTPCVDSLIAHSTTFRYSYCNGRKSIDGMPSILSSIPMFVEPFFLTPASMNDYTGIAGILGNEGYQTAFFHGAQNGSMGFQAFAQKTGFQRYYGRTEYEEACGTNDFDGTWAIWDEPFLQYYAHEMSKFKQPFMTALFTASSHHPFAIPSKYKQQFPEEHLPIQKCIRYTDMAIGRFFATARKQPWFKNTIFVLTNDHTNMSNHDEYQTSLGLFQGTIIFYDPSGQLPTGVMPGIAQQIDIMPTLLGILNYPNPYVAFGKDLLKTAPDSSWTVNYSNGIYQYLQCDTLIQFDGTKVTGVYDLHGTNILDRRLNTPPSGHVIKLKAIIQQYMSRMVNDKLTAE